jgi:hypothetical protein
VGESKDAKKDRHEVATMKRTVMLAALVVISFVMASDAARGQDPATGQNVEVNSWLMTKDTRKPMAKAGLELRKLYDEH